MCGSRKMQRAGGTGPSFKPDEDLKKLLKPAIAEYITKLDKRPACLSIVEARSQVVAGTNYFVKVVYDSSEVLHMCVNEALPVYGGAVTVLRHKKAQMSDPLEYF